MSVPLTTVVGAIGLRKSVRLSRLELKQAYVSTQPFYDTNDQSEDDCIIICGSPRSGTTLFREHIARHPNIACGPEMNCLTDMVNPKRLAMDYGIPVADVKRLLAECPSIVRFVERFCRDYAVSQGKTRWAEKTPANVRALPRLMHQFPRGSFVHVVRDGRDVACSLRNFPRVSIRKGKPVDRNVTNPISRVAAWWADWAGRGAAMRDHPRLIEVKYEDLVRQPEPELRRLCAFLDEDFDPAMLSPASDVSRAGQPGYLNNELAGAKIHTKSLGRWRRDLSHDERREVARVAGALLEVFGYAEGESWIDEQAGEAPQPRSATGT